MLAQRLYFFHSVEKSFWAGANRALLTRVYFIFHSLLRPQRPLGAATLKLWRGKSSCSLGSKLFPFWHATPTNVELPYIPSIHKCKAQYFFVHKVCMRHICTGVTYVEKESLYWFLFVEIDPANANKLRESKKIHSSAARPCARTGWNTILRDSEIRDCRIHPQKMLPAAHGLT